MAIINSPAIWGITRELFDAATASWGRLSVERADEASGSIFFDNLPTSLKQGLLDSNGNADLSKVNALFNNKAQSIINGIVKFANILSKIEFSKLPAEPPTKEFLRDAVLLTIDYALVNSMREKVVSNTFSSSQYTIGQDLTNWLTAPDIMGTAGYDAFLNSKIMQMKLVEDENGVLASDGKKYLIQYQGTLYGFGKFKTGEYVSDYNLDNFTGGTASDQISISTTARLQEKVASLFTDNVLGGEQDEDNLTYPTNAAGYSIAFMRDQTPELNNAYSRNWLLSRAWFEKYVKPKIFKNKTDIAANLNAINNLNPSATNPQIEANRVKIDEIDKAVIDDGTNIRKKLSAMDGTTAEKTPITQKVLDDNVLPKITTNINNITNNRNNASQNNILIKANQSLITDNTNKIATNTNNISTNAANITLNTTKSATNANNITNNVANITNNKYSNENYLNSIPTPNELRNKISVFLNSTLTTTNNGDSAFASILPTATSNIKGHFNNQPTWIILKKKGTKIALYDDTIFLKISAFPKPEANEINNSLFGYEIGVSFYYANPDTEMRIKITAIGKTSRNKEFVNYLVANYNVFNAFQIRDDDARITFLENDIATVPIPSGKTLKVNKANQYSMNINVLSSGYQINFNIVNGGTQDPFAIVYSANSTGVTDEVNDGFYRRTLNYKKSADKTDLIEYIINPSASTAVVFINGSPARNFTEFQNYFSIIETSEVPATALDAPFINKARSRTIIPVLAAEIAAFNFEIYLGKAVKIYFNDGTTASGLIVGQKLIEFKEHDATNQQILDTIWDFVNFKKIVITLKRIADYVETSFVLTDVTKIEILI